MDPPPEGVELVVRTAWSLPGSPSRVWPLLCDSRMDGRGGPLFFGGVPRPLRCQLPEGHGGVGAERACVADQGAVHQQIVEWVPDRRLAFRMRGTELAFGRYVGAMEDTIDLTPEGTGSRASRSTRLTVRGPWARWRRPFLYLGVKQVHRYVFRNWSRLSAAPPEPP